MQPTREDRQATVATRVARAPAALADLARPALEQAIGDRYELISELGRGGFGVVWAAQDRASGAARAVKFLRPQHAHGFPLVRFKREFRTARRISHPNCVQVHELDECDGLWFFSMERVEGANLSRTPKLGRDPVAIAQAALQVLAALDQVHGQAIVHRDIKPHNILVSPAAAGSTAPVVKLTDFGIAKVGDLDDDERLASILGSLPYMAPELINEGVADARCDLYSLGVTLYEALTGQHPLKEPGEPLSAAKWLKLASHGTMRPLRTSAPAVPQGVAVIVDRLLQRDPHGRYRSAAEAYDELAGWLARSAGRDALPAVPPLTGSPYLAAPRLVGRRREQRAIERFLAANLRESSGSSRGSPPLLLLAGPAGLGKSRLLAWLLGQTAEYSPRVLIGHGRSEIGGPFEIVGPILTGLRQGAQQANATAGAASDPSELTATVGLSHGPTGLRGQEVAAVRGLDSSPVGSDTGVAGPTTPTPVSSVGTAGAQELNQVLHEFTEVLLESVQLQPAIIIIEDLQWSDFETLELLRRWVRAVDYDRSQGRALPVAFVATCRPAAKDSELARLRRELTEEGRALTVELEALGSDTVTELASELLMTPVDDTLQQVCRDLFTGRPATPLYVAQVFRLLLARGHLTDPQRRWNGRWDFSRLGDRAQLLVPATVEEVVGESAARLSVHTKALLSLAAVIGRRVGLRVLIHASSLDEDLVRDCIEEAQRAGFLADDVASAVEERLIFTHDRRREAMYQALSPEQRRLHHSTVANALMAQSTQRGRDVAADLAFHTREASDHPRSYRYSIIAAEKAMRRSQFSRASELFAQAVDSAQAMAKAVPRGVWERLGDAASAALHVERAHQAYTKVLEQTHNITRRVRVVTKLGDLYVRAHDSKWAIRYYVRAIRLGLPWYLRPQLVEWLIILFLFPVLLFLHPRWMMAAVRIKYRGLSVSRLEALQQAALAAAVPSAAQGRLVSTLRFGSRLIGTGLALYGRSRLGSPSVGCAAAQFGNALLGRDRVAQRWAALGVPATPGQMSSRNRVVYHLIGGAANLFLAADGACCRELRLAVVAADERKDPLYVEVTGFVLAASYLLFAYDAQTRAAARRLIRFAEANNLEQTGLAARILEVVWLHIIADPAAAVVLADGIRARRHELDANDQLLQAMIDTMEPHNLLERGIAPATVAERTCAQLGRWWPPVIDLPVLSSRALVYIAAVRACRRLGRVPPQCARILARYRRRMHPVDAAGRWRRPMWQFGHALYDDIVGRPASAMRQLDRAMTNGARYPRMVWRMTCCRWGLMEFAPGSPLQQRCRTELDQLRRDFPDAGELIERIGAETLALAGPTPRPTSVAADHEPGRSS
jgi:hypothetical protein